MRTGNTRAYQERKYSSLQSAIQDHQKDHPDLIRFYGIFDPLADTERHINPCTCGGEAALVKNIPGMTKMAGATKKDNIQSSRTHPAWQVRCLHCDHHSGAFRKPWLAVINWNRSSLCRAPSYRQLPVFFLQDLTPEAASERLRIIRQDLELRTNEAGLKRSLGLTRTNQKHIDRLKAFLQWCIYAQGLVKRQRNAPSRG